MSYPMAAYFLFELFVVASHAMEFLMLLGLKWLKQEYNSPAIWENYHSIS
jgi:hypothetical protein